MRIATEGRLLVENLPAGTYRACVKMARFESPTPPAFEVAGELTAIEWPVQMPVAKPAFLRLFRADGTPILGAKDERVEIRERGESYTFSGEGVPSWVEERKPKGAPTLDLGGFGGGHGSSSHRLWSEREAGASGFEVGPLLEDSRLRWRTYRKMVRIAGGRSLVVTMRAGPTTEYVAVRVDGAELRARRRFPAGVLERDLSDEFLVTAEALAVGANTGRSALYDWAPATVHIRLQNEEFEPVDFTWCPADGPLPEIVLIPVQAEQAGSGS